MSHFFQKIETLLLHEAGLYTPDGTDPKAVVHQWIHSLAYDFLPFAAQQGVTKKNLIDILIPEYLFTDALAFKKLMPNLPITPTHKSTFTFIDLFAGIGGMRIGFQEAGGTCVFSSEFEKNAQATYFENHGDYPFGDITKIAVEDIPDHDVLVAGFPCQPFSHAGLKKGIDDTRGTLFHNIANILREKKPKVALLENVKGLISHDKGYTLQVILKTLIAMGYNCNIDNEVIIKGTLKQLQTEAKKMVLRSIDFGVPQNRQRIYIVLWKGDLTKQFNYPDSKHSNTHDNTEIKTPFNSILVEHPDQKYTISDRLWEGHKRRKINNAINGKGFGFGLVTEDSLYTNTISARYYKDGSEILIDQKDKNPRKLTPREAARLQGFPDSFVHNKSEVQAYRQFGNSVTVDVISALARQIQLVIGE